MSSAINSQLLRRFILLGVPLLALIATLIHPRFDQNSGVYDVLAPQVELWVGLHIVQLVIFGLLALVIYWLIQDHHSIAATISRIALFAFVIFYPAFDALAGIATGLFVQYGKALSPDQLPVLSNAIDAFFFNNQVVNNMATIGSFSWGVGVLAAAVALARPVSPRVPLGLVGLAIFVITSLSFALELDVGSVWWWVAAFVLAIGFGLAARPHIPSALLIVAGLFFSVSHVLPFGTVGMGALLAAVIHLVFFSQRPTAPEPVIPAITPVNS